MGRADLIGPGKHQLVPAFQPAGTGHATEGGRGHKVFHPVYDDRPHLAKSRRAKAHVRPKPGGPAGHDKPSGE